MNVGRAMGATIDHIHHVEKIDGEDGWELLRKIIFKDGDESMMPVLKDIGTRIVARCGGLPLAIKVMAGVLLCKERTRREWEKVLESDLWRMNQIDDEIPKALYLSYEELPSKLKPYFLSCALFRGSTHRLQLVTLWMAESFIVEQKNILMEELGEDYYKELITRNLLQVDPHYKDGSRFMMHDLLRALATNFMEEGITLGEGEVLNTNDPLTKIHQLSMSNKKDILTLPRAIKQNCLRVLLVYGSPETNIIKDDALKILRCLHVLNLSHTSIGSIPKFIGELLHLRCLYLDGTNIYELLESIGHLINLQTLSIERCRSLYRLPNSIIRLCNLRCLCLHETPLTHVPKGIGKLININYLDGFVIGHDDSASGKGCDLEELQYLSNLRLLDMQRLERASIKEGATVLANQIFLRELVFSWSEQSARDISNGAPSASEEEEIIRRAESVCSQLIPPSSLEDFGIFNFPGRRFPGWIMSTSLRASYPHLVYLALGYIPLCTVLPPLGQLPQLKYLKIKSALGIKKIGHEFLGCHGSSTFPAFPKLDYLEFEDMPNWEEWDLCVEQEEKVGNKRNPLKLFPNLTECFLMGCSRLIVLPEVFYHATNLKLLGVWGCERLQRISNLPPLKRLIIHDCPSLEHVESVDTPQCLLLTCPSTNNDFLPHWLLDLVAEHHQNQHSLKEFRMRCSLPLFKSCLEGKPNWHIIQRIPEVYIKTIDDKHQMWYIKDPPHYDTTLVVDSE